MSYIPPHLRNKIIQQSEQSTPERSSLTEPQSRQFSGGRWKDNDSNGYTTRNNGYHNNNGYYNKEKRGLSQDSYGSNGSYPNKGNRTYHQDNRRSNSGIGGRWREFNTSQSREEQLFGNTANTGINFDKYDEIPVETKGTDIPPAIDSFDQADLHPKLTRNIQRAKFEKPTPVQKYSIPIGIAKRDLMACAQTGSGKTGGFLFPIIQTLLSNGIDMENQRYAPYHQITAPQALILSPTRELSNQIFNEARKFTFQTNLKTVVVYGGSSMQRQISALQRGCNILVATPGRLADLVKRGHVTFEKTQFLVLDEADKMLDMGFEQQIREIVEGENMPPKGVRQTMMFSATFPKEIRQLASCFLDNYIFLTVGRIGSTTDMITQVIRYVEDEDKIEALVSAIEEKVEGLTLVFTKTKRDCDAVEYELRRLGLNCTSIHGDRSQEERERALYSFKQGQASVLVATDVASRGLDIPNVTHVVNFDMPENIDSYIHRIGRTGRAGREGLATSFYNRSNNMVIVDLVDTLKETNQDVPDWLRREKERYESHKNMKKRSSSHNNFSRGRFGSQNRNQSRWGSSSYNGGYGNGNSFGRSHGRWGSSTFGS